MKKFILHGDMAAEFCKEIKLNTSTMRETMDGLSANLPGFKKYFVDKSLKGIQYLFVDKKKNKLESYCFDIPLTEDEYDIVPSVEGAAGFSPMAFLGNFALGYGMQWLSDKLGPQDDGTPEYEIITTNSFIYKKNENRAEQGSPVPIIYGQLRVGSKIIHSSIHNYDYNYDDAYIYEGRPSQTRLDKLYNNAKYNFINPAGMVELRNGTPEAFKSLADAASDITKRTIATVFKSEGDKKFTLARENEAVNEAFENSDDGSNRRRHFGPSENQAVYTEAGASWWDRKSLSPRPFVYPKSDSIDKNMRPAGSEDLSVERVSKAGSIPSSMADKCLSYKNPFTPTKVGNRGSYNKLESISIYNSLEVISEGPIAGFSNPITGHDRDNGYINYPYGKGAPVFSEGSAKLGLLKFDKSTNNLISSDNNNSVVLIDKAGANYVDGSYTLSGDGTTVGSQKLFIKANKPARMKAASINDSSFLAPDNDLVGGPDNTIYHINNNLTSDPKFYSDNKLFILNSGDGSVSPNTNSNSSIDGFLSSKYLTNESTDNGTLPVFQLSLLEDDSSILGQTFKIGKGYGNSAQSFSISPKNEVCQFKAEIELLNERDRVSQAECLDIGSFLLGRESQPTIAQEILDLRSKTASTIPRTSLSWSKMVRPYLVGSAINTSSSITIQIGQWIQYRSWPQNNITHAINMTITLEQYVTLGNVAPIPNSHNNTGTVINGYSIWPDDQSSTANLFHNMVTTGASYGLGKLLQNKAFADNVFTLFQSQGNTFTKETMPSHVMGRGTGTATQIWGGGSYLKFSPGSGSTTASGTKVNSWGNHFPAFMLELGNDNFTSVEITKSGAIDEDESSDPKGYYSPLLFPRVTVYVLRESYFSMAGTTMSTFNFKPTSIDAVAQIDTLGRVAKIVLLKVPNNPVYDTNQWTPIIPQDVSKTKPFVLDKNSSNLVLADHGFYCAIDPSHAHVDGDFIIDKGKITYPVSNGNHRHLCKVEGNWWQHIQKNNPQAGTATLGAGLFEATKSSNVYNNPSRAISINWPVKAERSLRTPTATATAQTNIESINLSSGYKVSSIMNLSAGVPYSFICTGRPKGLNVLSSGSGYEAKIGNSDGKRKPFKLYNHQYGLKSIRVQQNGNIGYKPDQTFYAFGISKTKSTSSSGIEYMYFSSKLKITTDTRGKIDSVTIIDKGFGFSPVLDPDDFVFAKDANTTLYNLATGKNMLTGDSSAFIDPAVHFTKLPLILSADTAHLSVAGKEGSVSKFYVKQSGKGFNRNELILNPFNDIEYIPPVFDVVISAGKVTSVTLNSTYKSRGYSVIDQSIELSFASPPLQSPPVNNDPTADNLAWARSIYLNDVPMRDRNDRFNFSKFHFDMRIGHGKNGNGESNLILDQVNQIAPGSRPNMISDEFKLPSYTKVVDYPIYGPRNEGDKDYYYTHTIKNPEVSTVHISINIEKLHYTYEGDESALYVNLIPLMMAGVGFMAAKAMKDAIASALIQDPISLYSKGKGSGTGMGACPGMPIATQNQDGGMGMGTTIAKTGEIAKQAVMAGISSTILAGGAGLVLTFLLTSIFPCSKVQWLCFKIGEIIKNSGEIWPAKMQLGIEYGVEGGDMKQDIIAFRGCATNPYVKDILIDNLPKAEGSANNFKNRILKIYRTTRETDPISGGIVEARYDISAKIHSVTEYVEGFFGYPNTALIGTRINSKDHPQIPLKEYLIKGRMIRIPSNYNPEDGTYNGDWDGNFKYIDKNGSGSPDSNEILFEWTSNPAWIVYDLLTNERYGMGKYGIKDSDIDKWSFYTFSKLCDEKVDVVIDGVSSQERRHMCNLYIDQEREAYEYIKELMYIYNSTINFNGGKIYITTDSSVDSTNGSVMIFTNSNVEENSFEYASTPATTRLTAATVDFLDERDGYMQKTEYVEDSEGVKEHGYAHIKIAGIGITRRGEAHRLAWHKILTKQMEVELIKFKTGLQGSYLRIGDVVEVIDNNKISQHSGGRVARIVSSNTIELDIPASVFYPNTTVIYVQKPILSDEDSDTSDSSEIIDRREPQFEEYTITSASGFEVTFSTDHFLESDQGSTWIIKENVSAKIKTKKYRVKEIKETSELIYQIVGSEHLEDKYKNIDESTSSKDGIYTEEREYYGHDIIV